MGTFEFEDKTNNLKARLEFASKGGIFSRQGLPIDCFEGLIV